MLTPSSPNGGRCIYCAFRTRLLLLTSQRTRHIHLRPTPALRQKDLIRYTNDRSQPGFYEPPPFPARNKRGGRNNPHATKERKFPEGTSTDGPVRKYLAGRGGGRALAHEGRGEENFEDALRRRLAVIKADLSEAPLLEQLRKEKVEGEGEERRGKVETFVKNWSRFERNLLKSEEGEGLGFGSGSSSSPFSSFGKWDEAADKDRTKIIRRLREAFNIRGTNGLDDRIKYEFYAHITGQRFTPSDIKNQQALADLRYPSEWFPATRSVRRKIHLHVGPTNSGKTYHALQRLEQAETGVYAGPLRLLAHEVYTRMNAKGKACGLVTGEERRLADVHVDADAGEEAGTMMTACTVEMMPLNKPMDVAVIDEIQMIGNAERGWAWTQALLGVKAREVHLCGEERTVPLIREICASVGEEPEIHRYTRLSPLEVAAESLDGNLNLLRKGDCVVSFSVMGIHSLRRQIERATGKKVATVYGSLPPETRAQQARLFNDPENEYDFLVASDAVGMGLNLAIKRIIFETSSKFDGFQHRQLGVADIKQIAGRAGRYRTAEQANKQTTAAQDLAAAKGEAILLPPAVENDAGLSSEKENTGFVTTLQKFDYPVVAAAMTSEAETIRSAGLFPPAPVLERFAGYFPPATPFSYILTRLHELSQMHTRFHLCGLKDQVWIADLIEPIKGLTVTDRNIICSSPASGSDRELWKDLMPAYARCIAEQTGGNIVDIAELPLEVLEAEVSASREYLRELELLHKGLVCYLWFSYRFAGVFGQRALAFHVKGLVEGKIEEVLGRFSFSESSYKKVREKREKSLLRDLESAIQGGGEEEEGDDVVRKVREVGGVGDEEPDLREQTSLTAGGDRFGGEEDMGLEAPEEEEHEESGSVSSFSERHKQKTRTLHASDDPDAAILGDAIQEGENGALNAVQRDEVDIASPDRPAAVDEISEPAALDQLSLSSAASEEVLSPETDPTHLETPITPETELDGPPIETQEQPPKAAEPRIPDEEREPQSAAGQNQLGRTPPKHLAHLDVNGSELERNIDSRP